MKPSIVALAAIAALSACASASVPGPAQRSGAFTIAVNGHVQPQASPLVLLDQQFLEPDGDSALLSIPGFDSVQWSISGSAAQLDSQEPFTVSIPGDPAPTAPPGQMYVQGTTAHGKALVTATSGSQTATLTVLHYGSVALGCFFRYQPAVNFDPDRPLSNANLTGADLYVTAPASELGPLDPCTNTALATGTAVTWHAPNGATLIPVSSLAEFIDVTPAMWKNDGTSFSPPQSPVAILLKTAEGHYAKALLPVGPFDVTSTSSFLTP